MRTIIFTALTALALVANAAPAAAETRSISVSYEDLDLSSPSGIATLHGRIQTAAKKVCGRAEVREIADGLDQQRCMAAVSRSTSVQIARAAGGQPMLALNTARAPGR